MTQQTDDSHISFAKRLAHNNKKIREKTLKKLQRWLVTKSKQGELNHDNIIKIWKGLHYSMWYSDKPLLQESLALEISQIIMLFSDVEHAVNFFGGFCETIAREWSGIDRLRLDKFYMFIRTAIKCVLELCQTHKWQEDVVSNVVSVLEDKIISLKSGCPDSIVVYISEQLYTLYSDYHTDSTPGHVLTALLLPYVSVLANTPKKDLSQVVLRNLFDPIKKSDFKFNLDKSILLEYIFEEAKQEGILTRNRKLLYKLHKELSNDSTNVSLGKRDTPAGTQVEEQKPKKKKKTKKKTRVEPVADCEVALENISKLVNGDGLVNGVQEASEDGVEEPEVEEPEVETKKTIPESTNGVATGSPELENENELVAPSVAVPEITPQSEDTTEAEPPQDIPLTPPLLAQSPIPAKYRKSTRVRRTPRELKSQLEPLLSTARSQKKRGRKSNIAMASPSSDSPVVKKKVRMSLENNTVLFFKKNTSMDSPTPYDSDKTPTKGVLKVSPALTRSQSKRKVKSRVKK